MSHKRVKTAVGMSRHALYDAALVQAEVLPAPVVLPSSKVLVQQISGMLRRKEYNRVRGTGKLSLWPLLWDEDGRATDEPLELRRVMRNDLDDFQEQGVGSSKRANFGRFYFAHYDRAGALRDFTWIEDSLLHTSGALNVICPPTVLVLLLNKKVKDLWPSDIGDTLVELEQWEVDQSACHKRPRSEDECEEEEIDDETIAEVCAQAQEAVNVADL